MTPTAPTCHPSPPSSLGRHTFSLLLGSRHLGVDVLGCVVAVAVHCPPVTNHLWLECFIKKLIVSKAESPRSMGWFQAVSPPALVTAGSPRYEQQEAWGSKKLGDSRKLGGGSMEDQAFASSSTLSGEPQPLLPFPIRPCPLKVLPSILKVSPIVLGCNV